MKTLNLFFCLSLSLMCTYTIHINGAEYEYESTAIPMDITVESSTESTPMDAELFEIIQNQILSDLANALASKNLADLEQAIIAAKQYNMLEFEDPFGKTVLHEAAGIGFADAIQLLLNYGASIDHKIDEYNQHAMGSALKNQTALQIAAARGHIDAVQTLLNAGANTRVIGKGKNTLLHTAATRFGNNDVIQLLLDRGVPVDAQNILGQTALHIAASQGDEAAVRTLLAAGANRYIKDNTGKTPEDLSEKAQRIVEYELFKLKRK